MIPIIIPPIVSSLVLVAVRLVLVAAFTRESRHKFADMKGFAKNDGVPLSVAYVVATAEGLAALSMLSGVLAQWAGIGIMLLMVATIGLHRFKWHSAYPAGKGGWEYDLLLLVLAAVIVSFGAGEYTLGNFLMLF